MQHSVQNVWKNICLLVPLDFETTGLGYVMTAKE